MSAVIRLALAAACLLPLAAPAQKLFKCVDAKGKITYQEAACPVDKDEKKVDTSHAGKTDWDRAANERVKRSQEAAEAEAAYNDKRARIEAAKREEQRKLEEDAYRKKLLEEAGADAPPPKGRK
ncbi:MAG: DUF4124 domain-containing protein [Betaproteobacteria bacterium]|nr:DUF4124 domain-containing protein [Betaproteobacteria bacterium]